MTDLDRRWFWRPAVLALFACGLLAVPAGIWAQEEGSDDFSDEVAEDDAEQGDLGVLGGEEVDFGAVDELLEQDEEILSDPGTYTYDPGARRDPFKSLLERASADDDSDNPRPEGVPGLMIDEITIQGIFMLDDGPVAQVISTSADTSFLIRPGDQLWDGEVVSMTLNEVVFKQDADDPTSLKPFREVVKKLNPEE